MKAKIIDKLIDSALIVIVLVEIQILYKIWNF